MTSTYQITHPDFDPATMPPLPAGFVDRSFDQEPCPSFMHEATGLILWIDYANADDREYPDAPRFTLQQCTTRDPAHGWQVDDLTVDLLAIDDWSAVVSLFGVTLSRRISRATLDARARTGDQRIGTNVEAGEFCIVRTTYGARNAVAKVERVAGPMSAADAITYLESM